MNLSYHQYIPSEFHPSSRVWVYQCSRIFSISEALEIEPILEAFVTNWKSHGTPVKGFAGMLFGQFIIVMADESALGDVSGCSTDGSVRMIKQIEEQFNVNLFDRLSLAFEVKAKIQLLPLSQLNYAFDNNFINAETIYFNNLVATKEALLNNWMIPVKESWLAKKINIHS